MTHLNVTTCVAALVLLAVAAVAACLAPRRDWRPRLGVALLIAAVLRMAMVVMASRIHPYDFQYDFASAANAVLAHRDPILNTRPGGWNYLPTYAYLLAGAQWLHLHLGVPWWLGARLPPVIFDVALTAVVGRLAGREGRLRRLQYACNPIAILICAVHGQMESTCLFFAMCAFMVVLGRGRAISGRAAFAAGMLLAAGVSVKTWPAIFGPVLLLALPSLRRRVALVGGAVSVIVGLFVTLPLTVGTPWSELPRVGRAIVGHHPPIGEWGWSGTLLQFVHLSGSVRTDPLALRLATVGSLVTLVAVLGALWLWRRAHPLDVATAMTSAFLATTASYGDQYLAWPVPTTVARPSRWATRLQPVIWIYIAIGELPSVLLKPHAWLAWHHWYVICSLLVIAVVIIMMPWGRRTASTAGSGPVDQPPPELVVSPTRS